MGAMRTRVVRSPCEASPELETSPRSRESAVTPALVPAAGTAACTLGASSRLEGAWTAGTGAFSVSPAAVSRALSRLGRSEDVWLAASFPAVTFSVAGGGDRSALAGAVSLADVEPASGMAAGWGTASTGTSGCAGSSVLVSPAVGSNRGEQRSSSMRPESPPISSLRALLRQEASRVGVAVSPEAATGGGWAAKPTERGDLQRRRPTTKSIGAAVVK
jgi:hypothetical protein